MRSMFPSTILTPYTHRNDYALGFDARTEDEKRAFKVAHQNETIYVVTLMYVLVECAREEVSSGGTSTLRDRIGEMTRFPIIMHVIDPSYSVP